MVSWRVAIVILLLIFVFSGLLVISKVTGNTFIDDTEKSVSYESFRIDDFGCEINYSNKTEVKNDKG